MTESNKIGVKEAVAAEPMLDKIGFVVISITTMILLSISRKQRYNVVKQNFVFSYF